MDNAKNLVFSAMTALWLTACATPGSDGEHKFGIPLDEGDTTEYLLSLSEEDGCQPNLVETLVNRDVYQRLSAGEDFKTVQEDPNAETTLSERITIFKDMRTEKLSTFFDCKDENVELHSLAAGITANPDDPANPDKFRALLVNNSIGANRGCA